MGWRDIGLKEVYKFCIKWRSRKEIKIKFSLSNIESQHLCRYLKKMHSDIKVVKGLGIRRKTFLYKVTDEIKQKLLKN